MIILAFVNVINPDAAEANALAAGGPRLAPACAASAPRVAVSGVSRKALVAERKQIADETLDAVARELLGESVNLLNA